jgi:hypothetical protein
LKTRCSIRLILDDEEIAGSPYADRRMVVLDPVASGAGA